MLPLISRIDSEGHLHQQKDEASGRENVTQLEWVDRIWAIIEIFKDSKGSQRGSNIYGKKSYYSIGQTSEKDRMKTMSMQTLLPIFKKAVHL